MNIFLQIILPSVGTVVILYALYSVFFPEQPAKRKEKGPLKKTSPDAKIGESQPGASTAQGRLIGLESALATLRADYNKLTNDLEASKRNEAQLKEELNRRQEWVATSEDMLNKVKEENLELKKKHMAREKDSEEEFSKGVSLNREIKELNRKLRSLEKELKDKSEGIELQRHQIASHLKEVKAHQETVAKLKKKEEASEWVPKQDFNKLNEEYTELEKELEEKEQRLKSFAQEIMQLRNQLEQKDASQPQPQPQPEPQPGPEPRLLPAPQPTEEIKPQEKAQEAQPTAPPPKFPL